MISNHGINIGEITGYTNITLLLRNGLNITCKITVLIKAFTDGVNSCDVPWKHHKTIPPLLNIVKKSNILLITNFTISI